jgi:AraC-like DNA-binding protein
MMFLGGSYKIAIASIKKIQIQCFLMLLDWQLLHRTHIFLLLEKISLARIARVCDVSETWLQDYVNRKYEVTRLLGKSLVKPIILSGLTV